MIFFIVDVFIETRLFVHSIEEFNIILIKLKGELTTVHRLIIDTVRESVYRNFGMFSSSEFGLLLKIDSSKVFDTYYLSLMGLHSTHS